MAVLACPEMNGVRLRELAWELEKTGTDLCVAPALIDVAGPRTTIRPVAGLPLAAPGPPGTGRRQAGRQERVRPGRRRGGAARAWPRCSLAIAIAIWLADGGPVFFRQTRVGKDGADLHALQVPHDGGRRGAVEAAARRAERGADGVLFKMRRDPRITRPGSWLRRWSLDELPQLFNVLLGDMSLVGPRPALPEEAARYGDHMRRRLAVTPGLTGLWQVSGRSTCRGTTRSGSTSLRGELVPRS